MALICGDKRGRFGLLRNKIEDIDRKMADKCLDRFSKGVSMYERIWLLMSVGFNE